MMGFHTVSAIQKWLHKKNVGGEKSILIKNDENCCLINSKKSVMNNVDRRKQLFQS